MCLSLIGLAVSWAGVVEAGGATPSVEVKPTAISLDVSPRVEKQRACVLRCRGGEMNVLAAVASDPAVRVAWRADAAASAYVVTATLPKGYRTSDQRPVEVVVRTDLATDPLVRIPVRVGWGKFSHELGWLNQAKTLIGKPLPAVVVARLGGGKLKIQAAKDKVTVVVFSAHWCGHCDHYVPVIEGVWRDYAHRDVQFLGISAGGGNGKGIKAAIERWEVDWPLGVDWGFKVCSQFGVRAFPVVFLIGRDGIVEAVHGRSSNKPVGNGLDHLDAELRAELDILLSGGTRVDFPDWAATTRPAVTAQATATRPAEN